MNKIFVFYEDEEGTVQNICYQDRVFFCFNKNKEIRILNPLKTMDVLKQIKNGELKKIASGQYGKSISFKKYVNRKGVKKSWELLN